MMTEMEKTIEAMVRGDYATAFKISLPLASDRLPSRREYQGHAKTPPMVAVVSTAEGKKNPTQVKKGVFKFADIKSTMHQQGCTL